MNLPRLLPQLATRRSISSDTPTTVYIYRAQRNISIDSRLHQRSTAESIKHPVLLQIHIHQSSLPPDLINEYPRLVQTTSPCETANSHSVVQASVAAGSSRFRHTNLNLQVDDDLHYLIKVVLRHSICTKWPSSSPCGPHRSAIIVAIPLHQILYLPSTRTMHLSSRTVQRCRRCHLER